jgi:thermostable 8-oxoguanine DNA glycosylase
MIDPRYITNFKRSEEELQEFLLFCVAVAGKNASVAAKAVNAITENIKSPVFWHYCSFPEDILEDCQVAKIGQYTKLHRAIDEIAQRLGRFRSASELQLEDLLGIHGIGPKTARFFLLHTRPGIHVAVLDVHILRWMKDRGLTKIVSTPQHPGVYIALERLWLNAIRSEFPGKSPAEADLLIWLTQSGRLQEAEDGVYDLPLLP